MPEATMAQRISRAKQCVKTSLPIRMPAPDEWAQRLHELIVLAPTCRLVPG